MAFSWYIFKNVTVVNDYTAEYEVYVKCEYPLTKNIRYKKSIIEISYISILKYKINIYIILLYIFI